MKNLGQLMKQAQEMQTKMAEMQEKLETLEVSGSAGAGMVTVYDGTLFLHDDFAVGPGPKYHVYLVPQAEVRGAADVRDTMYVDLGRLKSFKGSQKYKIPAGVDLTQFPSVVIWCEQFSVLISPADLSFAGNA